MKLSLNSRTNLTRWAFVSVGAAFIAGAGGWMPAYADEPVAEITGIGTLGGSNSTFGAATPDGAFIVGTSGTGSSPGAFLWSLSSGVMQNLGTFSGQQTYASGVSMDGSVVVGFSEVVINSIHAFRWTQATGLQDLGTLGGNNSHAYAVSADGSVVAGNSYLSNNLYQNAFRWTQATGMQSLGTLGGNNSYISYTQVNNDTAISANGSVIIGSADVTSSLTDAFRWTQATGMQDLGNLGGNSSAVAVSTDGSVVVGSSLLTGNAATHAFRWTQATGMQDLGTLGGTNSTPLGLNPDGSVVVGYASTTSNNNHAFRWTASTNTMQDLGSLFSGASSYSYAYALNADGSVVVGYSSSGIAVGGPPVNVAFRWTQPTGMQSVEDWIVANGGSPLAAGNILNTALFVTVDGNTVIGNGNLNGLNQVYIARVIPAAGGGDEGEGGEGGGEGGGVLGMDDLENSLKLPLVAGAVIHDRMYSALTTDLEDPRPAKGQYAFSTEGIYGGYSKDEANGYGMSGVFKLVYGLTDTWRVGGSYIWSGDRLDMSTNGQITNNISLFGGIISYGDYKGDGLRGRMAMAYGTGGADLTRNYLTGEGMSQSYGQMSVEQYGYAAEVGYGFRVTPKTLVIPKVSFDWTRSNLGAYAENGGEFPALFNGTTLEDSFLRGGVAVQQAVTPLLNLNFDANYVVRLSSNQDTVSGTLIGVDSLGNFSQTMDLSKDWVELRAGLDFVPDPSAKDFHVTCGLQVNVGEKFDVPAYLVDAGFVVYF